MAATPMQHLLFVKFLTAGLTVKQPNNECYPSSLLMYMPPHWRRFMGHSVGM